MLSNIYTQSPKKFEKNSSICAKIFLYMDFGKFLYTLCTVLFLHKIIKKVNDNKS